MPGVTQVSTCCPPRVLFVSVPIDFVPFATGRPMKMRGPDLAGFAHSGLNPLPQEPANQSSSCFR